MKIIKKIIKTLTKIENLVMVLSFILMVVSYFISVVNRNIVKGSAPWTEEVALFSMVYMALLGTELGLRDGTQVSVTALTSRLEGGMKKIITIISRVIMIIFIAAMFYFGMLLVMKQIETGQTSPVLKISMYLIYFSLIISFGISLIVQVVLFILELKGENTDEIRGLEATNKKEEHE